MCFDEGGLGIGGIKTYIAGEVVADAKFLELVAFIRFGGKKAGDLGNLGLGSWSLCE
jgi:hypothetical protein